MPLLVIERVVAEQDQDTVLCAFTEGLNPLKTATSTLQTRL